MKQNHLNIPDENGDVYCHKTGEVGPLDAAHMENLCAGCEFFNGTVQGNGIECYWYDNRKDIEQPYIVSDPYDEKRRIDIAERRGR